MIIYKLILEDNNVKRYEYYPEGDVSAAGVIEFKNGEGAKLISPSPNDVKMYYAVHALTGIDTTKETGTIAWY